MEALPAMTPLRLWRLGRGLAQWELARRSGVSIHKLSFAERGLGGVLSRADRRRLAVALGVDEHALFPVKEGAWDPAASRVLALSDATGAGVTGLRDAPHPEGDGDA